MIPRVYLGTASGRYRTKENLPPSVRVRLTEAMEETREISGSRLGVELHRHYVSHIDRYSGF